MNDEHKDEHEHEYEQYDVVVNMLYKLIHKVGTLVKRHAQWWQEQSAQDFDWEDLAYPVEHVGYWCGPDRDEDHLTYLGCRIVFDETPYGPHFELDTQRKLWIATWNLLRIELPDVNQDVMEFFDSWFE